MNSPKHWFSAEELQRQEEQELKELNMNGHIKNNSDFRSYLLLNKENKAPDIHSHNLDKKNSKYVAFCLKTLTENLIKPNKLLELGCGAGFSTMGLIDSFPESKIFAVDASKNAIEYAQRNVNGATFACLGINPDTKIEGQPFDLTIAYEFYPFSRTNDFDYQMQMINGLLDQTKYLVIANAIGYETIFTNQRALQKQNNFKIHEHGTMPNHRIYKILKSFGLSKIATFLVFALLKRKFVKYIVLSKSE